MAKRTRHLIASGILGPLAVYPAMFAAEAVGWLKIPAAVSTPFEKYLASLELASCLAVIAYLMTWLYGFPLYLLLRRYRSEKLYAMLIGTMIPALFIGAIRKDWWYLVVFAYFSIWISLACWIIAVWLQRKHSNNSVERDADADARRPSS